MKKIVLLFVLIILASCSNDDKVKTYKSEGKITGYDYTLCACCGGYFVEIENKIYRFPDEFPNKENLDLENLPIDIKLDWELKKDACIEDVITISAIEQIQVVD